MKARKHKPKPWDRRVPNPANPFQGAMAWGWTAFHAGKPCPSSGGGHGKEHAMRQGWMKAKMAAEQGKKSL